MANQTSRCPEIGLVPKLVMSESQYKEQFAMRLYVLLIVVLVAIALPLAAQTGQVAAASAPGKAGIAQTVDVTATITAIDKATRDVTLKGPQGNEMTVTAGPEVRNFNKLKVGDQVMAKYVEALTLELVKGGGQKVARTEDVAGGRAKEGAQPAGAVGRQVTIVADVTAVDAAKQTVTLKGPKRTVELPVKDPEQFKLISVGDQVQATYTQALALAVEPAKK
jgi:hypothetical protein